MLINRKVKRSFNRKFVAAVSALALMSVLCALPPRNASADTGPLATSPIPDQTQNYKQIPVIASGVTNSIPTATTNSLAALNPILPVSDYDYVGVTIQFTPTASLPSTANTTIQVLRGPNASMLETVPGYTLAIPGNGTGQVTYFTNLDVRGAGVICFTNWGNSNAVLAISNIAVTASFKANRIQTTRP